LAVGGLLLVAQPASAQGTCIQDVWKAHGNNQNLQCTANDVTLSRAIAVDVETGGFCEGEPPNRVCKCFEGGTVTFAASFEMDLTADTRYDVGFYIASDGDPNNDGALTGQCTAIASLAGNTLPLPPDPNTTFINLDAAPDVCGDITGPSGTLHNPVFVRGQASVLCVAGPSGNLEVEFCTTWRQPGSNEVCLGTGTSPATNDVFPGSPSKCNCGTVEVPIVPVPPDITVTKTALTAEVPETGGSATYSVTVKNNNIVRPVTLTSLTDAPFGNITQVQGAVTATTCVPDGNTATCEIGGSIAAGATCSCTFTATVPAGDFVPGVICPDVDGLDPSPTPAGCFRDVVTAVATDAQGRTASDSEDAIVKYLDVSAPPRLTKTATTQCVIDATYTVVVQNNSGFETLTLNTLIDDVYGNITAVQGNIQSTTCGGTSGALPFVIAPGGNYTCSFVARINSCSVTVHDTVTAGTTDEDGVPFTPSDDARVVISVTTP
jgi:hypothetical protein